MSGSQTFRDVSAIQRTDEAALCAPPLLPAFPIFHWSPTSRRKQIERYGFRVQMRSVDGVWRPPYTCWARDPQLAWWLSGAIHPEIDAWDLWQTWSDVPSGMEALIDCRRDNGAYYVKEYRIYERVYKRNVWHVATRSNA